MFGQGARQVSPAGSVRDFRYSNNSYFRILNTVLLCRNGMDNKPIVVDGNIPPVGKWTIINALKRDSYLANTICIECNKFSDQSDYRSTLLYALNDVILQVDINNDLLSLCLKELNTLPYKYKSFILTAFSALQKKVEAKYLITESNDDAELDLAIKILDDFILKIFSIIAGKYNVTIIIDNISPDFSSSGFELIETLQKRPNIHFVFIVKPAVESPFLRGDYILFRDAARSNKIDFSGIWADICRVPAPTILLPEQTVMRDIVNVMAAFVDSFDLDALSQVSNACDFQLGDMRAFVNRVTNAKIIYEMNDRYVFNDSAEKELFTTKNSKISRAVVSYLLKRISTADTLKMDIGDAIWLSRNCVSETYLQLMSPEEMIAVINFNMALAKRCLIEGRSRIFLTTANHILDRILAVKAYNNAQYCSMKVDIGLKIVESLFLEDKSNPIIERLYSDLGNFSRASEVSLGKEFMLTHLARIYLDRAIRAFGQLKIPEFYHYAGETLKSCDLAIAPGPYTFSSCEEMLLKIIYEFSIMYVDLVVVDSSEILKFLNTFNNKRSSSKSNIVVEMLSYLAIASYFFGDMYGFIYHSILAFRQCRQDMNSDWIYHIMALVLTAIKVGSFLTSQVKVIFDQRTLLFLLGKISSQSMKKTNLTNAIICTCLRDLCQSPADIIKRLSDGYDSSIAESDMFNAVMNGGNAVVLTAIRGELNNSLEHLVKVYPLAKKVLATATDILDIYLCGINYLRDTEPTLIDDTSLAKKFDSDLVIRVNQTNTKAFRDHFALLIGIHTMEKFSDFGNVKVLIDLAMKSVTGALAYPISIHHYFLVVAFILLCRAYGTDMTKELPQPIISQQTLNNYIKIVLTFGNRYGECYKYMADCINALLVYDNKNINTFDTARSHILEALNSNTISIFDRILCCRIYAELCFLSGKFDQSNQKYITSAVTLAKQHGIYRVAKALSSYHDYLLTIDKIRSLSSKPAGRPAMVSTTLPMVVHAPVPSPAIGLALPVNSSASLIGNRGSMPKQGGYPSMFVPTAVAPQTPVAPPPAPSESDQHQSTTKRNRGKHRPKR